jgi:hypothetical protein
MNTQPPSASNAGRRKPPLFSSVQEHRLGAEAMRERMRQLGFPADHPVYRRVEALDRLTTQPVSAVIPSAEF